ncbi:hypothetical protein JVU11DRAFT_7522 [Chiua virens]|nr:hypothetical protein JVU11DRAFT_7522 [Chiua virens]
MVLKEGEIHDDHIPKLYYLLSTSTRSAGKNMDEGEQFVKKHAEAHPGYASFITHLTPLSSTYLLPMCITEGLNNPCVTPLPSQTHHSLSTRTLMPWYVSLRVYYTTPCSARQRGRSHHGRMAVNFLHGLGKLRLERTGNPSRGKGKGKGKGVVHENDQEPSMVILIVRAEMPFEKFPELVVHLSRLAELLPYCHLSAGRTSGPPQVHLPIHIMSKLDL